MTDRPELSRIGTVTPAFTLSFERRVRQSRARVWQAITEPGDLVRWMGCPSARVDLRVGGDYFVEFPEEAGEHLDAVVIRMKPEEHLAYAWGGSVVEWALHDDDDCTRYTFTHFGLSIDEQPSAAGIAAGWHGWLVDMEAYLTSGAPAAEHAWKTLLAAYEQQMTAALRMS